MMGGWHRFASFFLPTISRLGHAPALRSLRAFYISDVATTEQLGMVRRLVLSHGALFKRQVEEGFPLPAFWVR